MAMLFVVAAFSIQVTSQIVRDDIVKGEKGSISIASVENPYDLDFNRVNLTFNGTHYIYSLIDKNITARPYTQTQLGRIYFGGFKTVNAAIDSVGSSEKNMVNKKIKFGWNITSIPVVARERFNIIGLEFSEPISVEDGKHRLDNFLLIDYSDIISSGLNMSINSTDLLINITPRANIIIDPIVQVGTTVLSNYPTQRKIFWDGNNWFVFYTAGTGISHNYSSDLVSWNAGKSVFATALSAAARADVVFKNISDWKVFAMQPGIPNSGEAQVNFTRGTINADNGLNFTNNKSNSLTNVVDGSRASLTLAISSDNYYFYTTIGHNSFGAAMSNSSLSADTGVSWDSSVGSAFNISGASFGSNFPASKMVALENGNMMMIGKEAGATPIHARNFSRNPTFSWSASTQIVGNAATTGGDRDDFDLISLNLSGKLNAFLAYRNSTGSIQVWKSDGARAKWLPFINVTDVTLAPGNGTVLSKNDTHLFLFYIERISGNNSVMYRIINPSDNTVSAAQYLANGSSTKKGLTVSELSNGTVIAYGYTEVLGTQHNLTVGNLTHI